jgi:hypothetical protein
MRLYREVQRYDDNTIKEKYMVLRFYENQRKMARYILDEMDDAYYTFTDMGIAFEDDKGRKYFEWAYEYEDVKEANEIKDIYKEAKKKIKNNLTNKFKEEKEEVETTEEINNKWNEYDKTVANCHLDNFGKIYLDNYGNPIDDMEYAYTLHEDERKKENKMTELKENQLYKATKEYNNIMFALGYDHLTVGTGLGEKVDNWNLRDMVAEADYQLSTFYEIDHYNYNLKYDDPKAWKNETSRLKKFIKNYEPLTRKMSCCEGHYSKYD